MTDVAPLPVAYAGDQIQVVDTATGALVDLEAATDVVLVRALDAIVEHQRETTAWRRLVEGEVLRRMDYAAHWTIRAGGLELTKQGGPVVEYDAAALRTELETLVEAGRFGMDALEAAVAIVLTYKPKAAGLKALAKLGPDVADVIARNSRTVEKPRSVRVARES